MLLEALKRPDQNPESEVVTSFCRFTSLKIVLKGFSHEILLPSFSRNSKIITVDCVKKWTQKTSFYVLWRSNIGNWTHTSRVCYTLNIVLPEPAVLVGVAVQLVENRICILICFDDHNIVCRDRIDLIRKRKYLFSMSSLLKRKIIRFLDRFSVASLCFVVRALF